MSKNYVVTAVVAAVGALLAAVTVVVVKRSRAEAPPISPTVPRVDDVLPVEKSSSTATSRPTP